MLKLQTFCAVSILTLVSVMPGNAAAESIARANRQDVEMLLSAASGMNSAYWASLIGETRGRIYIEYETAVQASSLVSKAPKRIVYWLPRSEMSDEQLAKFQAYKDKYESRQ